MSFEVPYGFDAEGITTLVGWSDDPATRPTRSNIAEEFKRLAEVTREGDRVVIYLAGHGSQQPSVGDPNDPEPDGFDEIFLPADVIGWDGKKQDVVNAITDDELRAWLTAIRDSGAFVWVIIDACHSGTMTRGAPAERERRVPPSVLVPTEVLTEAQNVAARRERTRGRVSLQGGILGL